MKRDVLCNEVPLILRREIYATAAVAGGIVYVLLTNARIGGTSVALLTGATVFLLRLTAPASTRTPRTPAPGTKNARLHRTKPARAL
jgi:uncharacterized membrane protein YeiH